MKKNKSTITTTYKLIICATLCGIINPITSPLSFAADIPIETYVTSGVSIKLNGDWSTDLTMGQVLPGELSENDITAYWTSDINEDYISFADDSGTSGFYITIKFTDIIYSGASQTQNNLDASNYKVVANYDNDTPQPPDLGDDDPNKSLSILPNSCQSTDTTDFNFNPDFSDNEKDYALSGSTSNQTLLISTNSCLALGHIRFDRTEMLIPQNSEEGNYSTTITLTIIDGSP